MDRYTLEFSVDYSCRLEKMSASLWGRIDKFISLFQICLGASAFASIANIKLVGSMVVISSAYSLVYQPGSKAVLADLQKRRYESLAAGMPSLSDDSLREAFGKIQEGDSAEIGALCNAAHIGEEIRRDHPATLVLSLRERTLAWLAGDLPRAGLPTSAKKVADVPQ